MHACTTGIITISYSLQQQQPCISARFWMTSPKSTRENRRGKASIYFPLWASTTGKVALKTQRSKEAKESTVSRSRKTVEALSMDGCSALGWGGIWQRWGGGGGRVPLLNVFKPIFFPLWYENIFESYHISLKSSLESSYFAALGKKSHRMRYWSTWCRVSLWPCFGFLTVASLWRCQRESQISVKVASTQTCFSLFSLLFFSNRYIKRISRFSRQLREREKKEK